MTEENTTETQEQPTPSPAVQQLTINDMIVLKNMVEICSSRGAFKADEMSTVGGVYNKLALFLQAVMPPNTGNAAPAGDTTGNVATDSGNVDMTADGEPVETGNVAPDTGNIDSGDSA